MDWSVIFQLAISVVSLLCCCTFWAVVAYVVYKFFIAKGGDAASAASGAASSANKLADQGSASAPAEDEMETVVASAPPAPKAEAPKGPEAKEAPGRPPPRSAGATIIAFDDDFDED